VPLEQTRSATLVVDLDALARNFAKLRAAAAPAECAAVVKADAYGLGVERVAKRLVREGCRRLFVATAGEACELRGYARDADIYVLEGVREGQAETLAAARAVPVLNSLEQIGRWSGRAVLQIDTGMGRLGLDAREVEELARRPELLERVGVELVLTHFACADEPEHPLNAEQLRAFERLRRRLPQAPSSIGNSAATLIDAQHRGDVARLGIALYGGDPFFAGFSAGFSAGPAVLSAGSSAGHAGRGNPMETVATLTAPIVQIRDVEQVQTVGYGATYVVQPPARLAIVGAGYADGYPRALGNRGAAALGGRRVPVVGRVSMDLLCLDVSGVPADVAHVSASVELIGATVTVDEVAAHAGTISYEVLTGLSPRLRREYRGA
jgi:alanine racemase